jgi:transposase
MSEEKTKRAKRRYDEEFRRNAVALARSSGRPLKELAEELGVSYWNLRDWSQGHNRKEAVPAASAEQVQRELTRLRRENEKLHARCDVLKKALGILAEPKDNATSA